MYVEGEIERATPQMGLCQHPAKLLAMTAVGTLYIVATPIGHLQDITLRALDILKLADLIACEDTRRTAQLLTHFGIRKPLISYFQHNRRKREGELMAALKSGKNLALVTDAGTPAINDPGADLVTAARTAGIARGRGQRLFREG